MDLEELLTHSFLAVRYYSCCCRTFQVGFEASPFVGFFPTLLTRSKEVTSWTTTTNRKIQLIGWHPFFSPLSLSHINREAPRLVPTQHCVPTCIRQEQQPVRIGGKVEEQSPRSRTQSVQIDGASSQAAMRGRSRSFRTTERSNDSLWNESYDADQLQTTSGEEIQSPHGLWSMYASEQTDCNGGLQRQALQCRAAPG